MQRNVFKTYVKKIKTKNVGYIFKFAQLEIYCIYALTDKLLL